MFLWGALGEINIKSVESEGEQTDSSSNVGGGPHIQSVEGRIKQQADPPKQGRLQQTTLNLICISSSVVPAWGLFWTTLDRFWTSNFLL